jgi:hypothetical protein
MTVATNEPSTTEQLRCWPAGYGEDTLATHVVAKLMKKAADEIDQSTAVASTLASVLTDIYTEIGCKHDNEAALLAIQTLKRLIRNQAKTLGDTGSLLGLLLQPVGESEAAHLHTMTMLNELRADEGNELLLICPNPDFNGQPNERIDVAADWTGWNPVSFAGDTLHDAVKAAHAAMTSHKQASG